jgi:structural maintenance of chromosome 1
LEKGNTSVDEFRAAIAQVEDEVFADFCGRLGYSDIRAYDASQGKLEQEVSERRNQFEVQKQRLENRLKWELTRHGDTESRIRRMQDHIRRLKQDIKSYSKEKADIEGGIRQDQDELDALRDTLEEQKTNLADKNQKVSEARSELQKRSKDIEVRQRDINTLETVVQKNSASKSALLRRCRLEQIQIPLVEGTLDNLPNEDDLLRQDPEAMDIDEDDEDMMDIALDDHGIAINFDGLDLDLKEVKSPNPSAENPWFSSLTNLCSLMIRGLRRSSQKEFHCSRRNSRS